MEEQMEDRKKIKKTAQNKSSGKRYKEKTRRQKDEESGSKKKSIIKIAVIIGILIFIIFVSFLYLILKPKFRNITIELGKKEIAARDFLRSNIYARKAEIITDLSTINLNQVGEIPVKLKFYNREEEVILKIVDTTPPKVKFKNIVKSLGYEINPEDFILEKTDLSDMTVEIIEAPEIVEYGDYQVKVKVKDAFGNETIGESILTISWLRTEVDIELGDNFSAKDIILSKEYEDRLTKEQIKNVDTEEAGEYTIKIEDNDKEYTCKVIVQDTTPPELMLRDLSIYDDEKVTDYTKFIKKVTDLSGKPTTTLKTEIDYKKIGDQQITIEAVDKYGNKIEKTATLTIRKDTDGPVFSGLKDISVSKNTTIDYYVGVKAIDKRDGNCEFTVDTTNVNLEVAGTYYATYVSKDSRGNKTTKKREITVKHDQADTTAKFDEFYNTYLVGKDPVGMASAIRTQIKYNSNWGEEDPVWYGLTQGKGNCFVHASLMKRALEKAGYQQQIIYLEDQSHYWNLVYVNGVWRHIDATPSPNHTLGLLTDAQKLADPGVHQKTWDTSKWPAAE